MKKLLLAILFLGAVPGVFAQQLSRLGILPIETAGGASPGDAANLTRQVLAELGSWGTLTVLEGDEAQKAEYIVRGRLAQEGGVYVLSAVTERAGRKLNDSKEQAATINGISVFSFCTQAVENVPYPNYLLGKWQAVINLPDGPVSCVLEFKTGRVLVIERFGTWEHKKNNLLIFEGTGTGSYSYAGYMRRNMTVRDSQGNSRQSPVDATVAIDVQLEDALPEYAELKINGLRVLFNESKNEFEFAGAGLPCGRNFDGAAVYPSGQAAFTRFTKTR